MNPIETGNIVLILLGIVLVGSGPIIIYRTGKAMFNAKAIGYKSKVSRTSTLFGDLLNFVIAVLFIIAGILFILNNLKGNPLA